MDLARLEEIIRLWEFEAGCDCREIFGEEVIAALREAWAKIDQQANVIDRLSQEVDSLNNEIGGIMSAEGM